MVPPISNLTKSQQRKLLDDLNYLNTAEIKAFCKKHQIPYVITIETGDGSRRRTTDHDRKGVMLARLRHFLKTGVVLKETCFRAAVLSIDALPKELAAIDRLFYKQYHKTNRTVIALLKDLTDGEFKDGAIARILAREFWATGKAPTFREYACAWRRARRKHNNPNPEWAFLSDRANRAAGAHWKKLRVEKAKNVIRTLNQVSERKP